MTNQLTTSQLQSFLVKDLLLPLLPMFNRLEARPRTHDFDRALKAEVRDALWMLTKQWQMGEFKGDDAGSPTSAKIYLDKSLLTKYKAANGDVEPFDDRLPLEAEVERRRIPFKAGNVEIALNLRLVMGRHWSKLLAKNGFDPALKEAYIREYPIFEPDPSDRDHVYYCSNQQSWRKHAATVGRHVDGKKLYDDIIADSGAHVNAVSADPGLHADLIALGERFVAWFDKLYLQPAADGGSDAWLPSNMEYRFACSAPAAGKDKVFRATEYYHGHLDWYNFSIDPEVDDLGSVEPSPLPDDFDRPIIRSFIPTPAKFDGMPNTRWWSFEEGRTNFGDINPDTTDINKLLLIEFGLVYANDWYLLPLTLPAGALVNVRGMSVKNVFGENFWITATGKGQDDNPNRWTMYSMDIAGQEALPADLSLMMVPSVPKIQEGKALEEVQLARDEVANMVWGIEQRIPLPSGESVPGREAGLDTLRHLRRLIEASTVVVEEDAPPVANVRYKVMSSVPENWIPFIPTHEENSNRETRLQRGSMPRILDGDPEAQVVKVKPRSSLLREGLDESTPVSYFVNEEEVLRAGVNVTQSFQRTRWYKGEVFNWLGVRKRTGRGESGSQLQFDYVKPVKKGSEQ